LFFLPSEIQNQLQALSYPINPQSASLNTASLMAKSSKSSKAQADKNEAQVKAIKEKCESMFKKLASQLLQIESPDFRATYLRESDENSSQNVNSLIQILISPLEKKFKFHFFTNRKTNNLDKVILYRSSILLN
jgi:hypothetical protein